MEYTSRQTLAPAGSTGNNTHASVNVPEDTDTMAVEFEVTAVGATPTVTWKVQGTPDARDVTDANSSWYDIAYVTDASSTESVTARTATAVGSQVEFLALTQNRFYQKIRLVTSANTNVTYKAEAQFRNASE